MPLLCAICSLTAAPPFGRPLASVLSDGPGWSAGDALSPLFHPAVLALLGLASGASFLVGRRRSPPAPPPRSEKAPADEASPEHQDLAAQVERLKALHGQKAECLEMMAHDMVNPLGNILELTRELTESLHKKSLADPLEAGRCQESLSQIARSSRYMLDLLRAFMQCEALEADRVAVAPEVHELLDLARESASLNQPLAKAKQIQIQVDGTAGVRARLDFQRTLEVLDNLVSNAVKFSPAGAAVTLRVAADSAAGTARLSVLDEGPGLSAGDLSRLFQKFQRLSASPTAGESSVGLGLVIAKRLTEMQGGALTAANRPSRGAAFSLEFPLAPREP